MDPIPLESLPAIVEDGDTSGVEAWPGGAETVVAVFEKTLVAHWPAEAGFAEAWGVALSRYWGRPPEPTDLELRGGKCVLWLMRVASLAEGERAK